MVCEGAVMTMTLLMTVTMMGVNRKSARTRENVDFYTIREREATLTVMNGERNTKDGHARARARERKNATERAREDLAGGDEWQWQANANLLSANQRQS